MENFLDNLVDTSSVIEETYILGFTCLPLSLDGHPKRGDWMQRSYEDYEIGFEPGDNVGVITGRDSKTIVIEFEARNLELLERWLSENVKCETPYVRAHNGYHYYFDYDYYLEFTNTRVELENGEIVAKIKKDGCFAIFPGSIIENIKYEWRIRPEGHEYQPIPNELLAMLQPNTNNITAAENNTVNVRENKSDVADVAVNELELNNQFVIFDKSTQISLENHLPSGSAFTSPKHNSDPKVSNKLEDLMNNAQVVDLLYNTFYPRASSTNQSPNVVQESLSKVTVENKNPILSKNRLQELNPVVNFALSLGFVPIALDGKKPVLPCWQKIQKDNALNKINEGFARYNANNIGVRCGNVSGIVVVDIDTKNDGLSTWNSLISTHGDPYTFKVRTGSGGYHYYFMYDSDNEMLKSRSGAVKINGTKVGIDIKSNGGQVVFISSIHPDTKQLYEWVNNNPNGEQSMPPISKMPTWLLALLLETEGGGTSVAAGFKLKTKLKPQLVTMINGSNIQPVKKITVNERATTEDSPPVVSEETLIELVDNLNSDRASNYDDWLKVVWAIKTVSSSYYHIAQRFSQRTKRNNYNEGALQKVWNEGKGYIGIGSLLYWLKWDVDPIDYFNFLDNHGLHRWEPIPCEAVGEGVNFHANKITWHSVIQKYHGHSVWDIRVVVKDIMECIGLVVGADEVYFVKERYDKYDALQYNLCKSSKFEKNAGKYYFMECKRLEGNQIKRMTWSFKDIIRTYLSRFPYNCIDFAPAGNEPGAINTFTGLRAKRVEYRIEDLAPILNHIREALCNDDIACYEYFLNKLAYFLQNLGLKKLGVADMIISPQGIGKNIFYEHFGRYILGEQYWYITSDINKLTGRFNKNMMGKLLIIGDEAKGHGKTAELIKPLITQEVQWVEPKGFEQFKISDWAMYAFFANSARYFEVEDGDRRYFVLRGNEKYKGNKEYFDNFSAKFQQFSDAFYSFLMDRDISSFNIQHIPCTPIKLILQESAGSSCRVFIKMWNWKILKPDLTNLLQYCEDGEIPIGGKISLADLHSQYIIWCKRNGVAKEESKIQLGKDLADLLVLDRNKMKWMVRAS